MSLATSSNDGGELAEKVLGGQLSDEEFLQRVKVKGEPHEDDDVPAAQADAEDAQPISPERSISLSGAGGIEDVSDGASLVGLDVEDGTNSVGDEASSSVSTADTLPPHHPAITYFPKQVVPEPLCCKCGRRVDPFKTKLVKKVTESAAFKCPSCNTKHVQLCGIFGHWPVKEFQEQSIEEQQRFWAEKTKGKKEIEDSVMKHIVRTHMERLIAKDDGDYLPIGVYKTRGFDPDLILKHCNDKVFEEDKGWCYKVRIHGDSKHTIDELADKKMLDMKNRGRKRNAPQGDGGEKRRRRNDGDDDHADSESAEGESADDDDDEEVQETAAEAKARKQEEKKVQVANKKAEKERVALLNKAAKEVLQTEKKAKQEAAKVVLAAAKLKKAAFTKVISKVQGPIAALSAVINDPVGIYVPQQGMDEAKAALEQLMTIFTECSTAIATMAAEATPPTLESVADILVIAEGKHKAMQALLANARKTRNIPAPTGSK